MISTRRLRLVASCALAVLLLGSATAQAEELPPGFTDGTVVGGDDPPAAAAAVAPSSTVGTAATTMRYFGRGPYEAVRAAAAAAASAATCIMSVDGLTGLVLAPVFKESSAATTPSTAPSPMTLSRYDEWSGTYGTNSNVNANYGLYAFRDPYTTYQRAYWHPGVGIWQYDSAGVGAPFTTVESMRVSTVAADVARGMAARFCNPSSTTVGHPAPFTDQERRFAAWAPWGYPCTLCEQYFQEMTSSTPRFANLGLVEGIGELGGTVARTCTLLGVSGTLPCWYVEPVVGTIQGATAWATLSPAGGTGPTVAPAPLSYPFYVVDRGTTEERHWLREDTGYGIDISASRQIGRNARPRATQAGSGLTWASTSGLCDLASGHGTCGPVPPPGVSSSVRSVGGSFRSIPLDANGDGLGDVLWYTPGSGADALWLATGPATFTSTPLVINTSYDTVVPLDVDGDGDDDLLWYDRARSGATLWRFDGTAITATPLAPGAGRVPLPMALNSNPAVELLWYGPGTTGDSVWAWNGTGFNTAPRTINGVYVPITGDFDGNGRDDVIWYAPGGGADSIWYHALAGGFTSRPVSLHSAYRTAVGDFDGDGRSDIAFHSPGPGPDSIWFGEGVGAFGYQTLAVNRSYLLTSADLYGSGRDALVWYIPGTGPDALWMWSPARVLSSQPLVLPGAQLPVVGGFSVGGADGIFWYGPGSEVDVLWYR